MARICAGSFSRPSSAAARAPAALGRSVATWRSRSGLHRTGSRSRWPEAAASAVWARSYSWPPLSGLGEVGPGGDRGDPHRLAVDGEAGRGDLRGQDGQPLLDVRAARLRQQHQQVTLAVAAEPLQRHRVVTQQVRQLLGQLDRDAGPEPGHERGTLLEPDHAERAGAPDPLRARQLTVGLVQQRLLRRAARCAGPG